MPWMSVYVASAPSRSALFTTNTSAISRMPALTAWIASPMPGASSTSDGVGQARDLDLGLPDADGLDQHDVAAGAVEHPYRLRRGGGQPAQVPTGRHRPDVDAWVGRVVLHPDPVAEDRSAGERAGRVDGQHADPFAGRSQRPYQLVCGGRLADAGRAGQADRPRPSRCSGASAAATSRQLLGRPSSIRLISRATAADHRRGHRRPAPARRCCAGDSPAGPPPDRSRWRLRSRLRYGHAGHLHDQSVALAAAAAQGGRAGAAAPALAAPWRASAPAARRTCRSGGRVRSRRR